MEKLNEKRQARIDAIESSIKGDTIFKEDAASSAFFARELENVEAETYMVEYPEFKMTSLVPVTSEAGAGAESHTYYMFDKVGVAQLIKNYATDFKRVDVKGSKFTLNFENFGDSYGYNFQEIENAKFAKRPIDRMRAETAREVVEAKIEQVMAFGEPLAGISGFFNNANLSQVVLPNNSTATNSNWELKTPEQVIADISSIIRAPYLATAGREKVDSVILPNRLYLHLEDTPMGNNLDKTILNFLEKKFKGVTFSDHHLLDSFQGAALDRVIAYSKNPRKLKFHLPVRYKSLLPFWDGSEYSVKNYARMGGLQFVRPLSAAYAEVAQ